MYIIMLLVGLGLIVLGADWLVNGASSIARRAGISEFIIGLTIVPTFPHQYITRLCFLVPGHP